MHVYAIELDFNSLDDRLFERALQAVDDESRKRVRMFFQREDAWRTLLGRILPLYVLQREHGIPRSRAHIARTSVGKPYLAKGAPPRGFKFNVSHDSNLVVLACSEAGQGVEVGVDVMRCALPGHESLRSFVSVLSDQLTPLERISVLSAANGPRGDTEPIENLYRIWALKEAYTKVLGLGLGFDFSRVEYDVNSGRVRVDRTSDLPSWEFVETTIDVQGSPCAITAARCGIAGASGGKVLRRHADDGRWLIRMDARNMLEEYLRLAQ